MVYNFYNILRAWDTLPIRYWFSLISIMIGSIPYIYWASIDLKDFGGFIKRQLSVPKFSLISLYTRNFGNWFIFFNQNYKVSCFQIYLCYKPTTDYLYKQHLQIHIETWFMMSNERSFAGSCPTGDTIIVIVSSPFQYLTAFTQWPR